MGDALSVPFIVSCLGPKETNAQTLTEGLK